MNARHWCISTALAGALVTGSGCDGTLGTPPSAPTPPPTSSTVAESVPETRGPALTVVEPLQRGLTVAGVAGLCDDNLALAQEILAAIRALPTDGTATLSFEDTFGRLDDAFLSILNGSEFPYLVGVAHPDEAVRNAARACETKTDKLLTSIWLDPTLARVLEAYAARRETLGVERERFVSQTLRDFRRNGSVLPAAGQARLREINDELTQIGQRFIAEISSSKGVIEIRPEQLAGLPDGYVETHRPRPDGKVEISTDYPDYYPFVKYALDRRAARDLYVAFVNRGGEVNVGRLDRLLQLRHEKARLLGYATWADYAIEPRMAKTAAEVEAFLDRVSIAIAPAVKAEFQQFAAEFQSFSGGTNQRMTPADRYFLNERLKNKRYAFDGKKLAEYFDIDRVTGGLFDISSRMYGIEFRKEAGPTWHPEVRAYSVWSGDRRLGDVYLDLFSRDHKYKHAAMFTIRTGKKLAGGAVQTPIASLICNFPRPGEPMAHDQVVTYFHEFGHVLHHLLSDTELSSFAGTNTARDFVETPSQMFEEWAWSREVLDLFARHPVTGEPIPTPLYEAMTRARRFGMSLGTERQLFLARLDLAYHTQEPGFDTTELLQQIHKRHFSFAYVPNTHFQSSFGHLIGYDAGYYGYQWALSLSFDVLSRFKKEGLMNQATARAWREQVLSKGASVDERDQVTAFLGRPPSEQAYADFLQGKD